jgi:hypothetical protein
MHHGLCLLVKTSVTALWDLGEMVRYHASINLGSQRHNPFVNQMVSVVELEKVISVDNLTPRPVRIQSGGKATRLNP